MNAIWINHYQSVGIPIVGGLPGGNVDCHLSLDSNIALHHALMKYNHRLQQFTVQNLSSTIQVNGEKLLRSDPAVVLPHKATIRIENVCFQFLLPTSTFHFPLKPKRSTVVQVSP